MKAPHISLAQKHWAHHLSPTDFAIDMTCGNGHDTLFLRQLLTAGTLFGFDIQPSALQNTKDRLQANNRLQGVHLFLRSHANLELEIPFPKPPQLVVYNLGYLPGGDKGIVTTAATTLQSLAKATPILPTGGALSIICYPGHPEGRIEEEAVLDWASSLPSQEWEVCFHRWINRVQAPSFCWIVKRGSSCH